MAKVEIYTTRTCPYCARAKALFDRKGVPYTEIDVSDDTAKREKLVEMSGGRRTVPQIFIDGKAYGGSDDVHALDAKGELDKILKNG